MAIQSPKFNPKWPISPDLMNKEGEMGDPMNQEI